MRSSFYTHTMWCKRIFVLSIALFLLANALAAFIFWAPSAEIPMITTYTLVLVLVVVQSIVLQFDRCFTQTSTIIGAVHTFHVAVLTIIGCIWWSRYAFELTPSSSNMCLPNKSELLHSNSVHNAAYFTSLMALASAVTCCCRWIITTYHCANEHSAPIPLRRRRPEPTIVANTYEEDTTDEDNSQ